MASRNHTSHPFTIYMAVGAIKFNHVKKHHTTAIYNIPDSQIAHMTHVAGDTAYTPAMTGEDTNISTATAKEAESPTPGKYGGEAGRMVKVSGTLVRPPDPPSMNVTLNKLWGGKVFARRPLNG